MANKAKVDMPHPFTPMRSEVRGFSKRCKVCGKTEEEHDRHFCPKCGCAWITHNDDGSCVEDKP